MDSLTERAARRVLSTLAESAADAGIEDACWQIIQPVSGFIQHDPINGAKASEETYVWMAYDSKYLYFAFFMEDSQPDKIWAELTPRNDYEDNDSITVILDAYNDKPSFATTAGARKWPSLSNH